MPETTENILLALTADIVAAHVANNSVQASDIANLISTVHGALSSLDEAAKSAATEKPQPAVSIRSSVKPDRLISLIDGKPYRMLKRHLGLHGYTPDSYRETFGLARDYPMVASDYLEKRRAYALSIGLGKKTAKSLPGEGAQEVAEAIETDTAAMETAKPKTIARKPKEAPTEAVEAPKAKRASRKPKEAEEG